VKKLGYGLLGLMPDQLFSLTLVEFWNMVDAKLAMMNVDQDINYERSAWQTALNMSSTGNYGKKGIDPKKLYQRRYDNIGRPLETVGHGDFKPIDKEEKDKKLNELIAKFNKRNQGN
jgi:hypothetical protein